MALFSTRLRRRLSGLVFVASCQAPQAPGTETREEPVAVPARTPVDPGEDGQSRTLLQHYRARDLAGGKLSIPSGDRLAGESTAWQLPFQSKRMIAAFLTSVARGAVDEMQHTLAPNATFGRPDARRPHERPIFDEDNLLDFFDGVTAAATRFDATAKYVNPTSFLMGLQEHIRTGAEPMWAYYESGPDRLLFRFRVYGNRSYIDYVGFFPEAPSEAMDYSALGPAPKMMPPVLNEGQLIHDFDATKKRGAPTRPMTPPRRPR